MMKRIFFDILFWNQKLMAFEKFLWIFLELVLNLQYLSSFQEIPLEFDGLQIGLPLPSDLLVSEKINY